MNTLLVLMLLVLQVPVLIAPDEAERRPLTLPTETLDDAFRGCGMAGDGFRAMEMMDSTGGVTSLLVPNVLETEVLSVVDASEEEAWFHILPDSTRLMGIGIIVYQEDTIDNRDSFMMFVTEVGSQYRWWFTIFSENIFLAPSGQLEAWILEEANYCGLFEISLQNPNEIEGGDVGTNF